jgi:hypothetical protein
LQQIDAVGRRVAIAGHEDQAFDECLRDQHAIKWIAVVMRQGACPPRMSQSDRQLREVVRPQGLFDRAGVLSRPSPSLIAISQALAMLT